MTVKSQISFRTITIPIAIFLVFLVGYGLYTVSQEPIANTIDTRQQDYEDYKDVIVEGKDVIFDNYGCEECNAKWKRDIFIISNPGDFPINQSNSYSKEDAENYVFEMINHIREEHNLNRLERVQELDDLAEYHSNNMGRTGHFDHVDNNGRSPSERADLLGIEVETYVSENIAKFGERVCYDGSDHKKPFLLKEDYTSFMKARCVMSGFITSPGHYKNILFENHREVGISIISVNEDGTTIYYTTQNFRG